MNKYEIGSRIKKARIDAGLTQAEVAKSLNVTYQAISNYERGVSRVDTDTLTQLCTIYGIKVREIFRTPVWDSDSCELFNELKTARQQYDFLIRNGVPDDKIALYNNLHDRFNPETTPILSDDESQLVSLYRSVNAEGKKTILKSARYVASDDDFKESPDTSFSLAARNGPSMEELAKLKKPDLSSAKETDMEL